MSIDGLVLPLLSARIFTGLTPRQLKSIALIAEKVVFDDGVDLIRDGEAGVAAFVIAAGGVAVSSAEIGEEVDLVLGPGTVVGELAMFVDMVHEATVTARGEVHALRISRSALLEALAGDPSLSESFVEIMRRRLEVLAARLREADELMDSALETVPLAASHH